MTLLFSKSDPRAPMLLAVYEGTVTVEPVPGFNTWHSSAGPLNDHALDELLNDNHIAPAPGIGGSPAAVTITGTGEALLIILYGITPKPFVPKDEVPEAPHVVAGVMTDKRANALYDVRQGYVTAVGTGKTGKTKWASTSHDLPTVSLDWLLANGLITHAPVTAGGSSTVTTTPLGDEILWTAAGVPPLAVTQVSFGLYGEVDKVLTAAGAGNVRNMPVIGTDTPLVHIQSYGPQDEAKVLNAAGKALLEHGGFDVRVGRDGAAIVLIVNANPTAAPRANVSDTHITDVLTASGY
ncbi:hypothetical protein [Arthrobacter sp. UYCo732]|uniref:hypothetical protein n=1 Tax=Arthrobacter sp. UYCo732 TaxID=3156336 RepID=UPI00339451EF